MPNSQIIISICLLIFLVAMLYSSVGHGGASGYLAVMSMFAFMRADMKTTALMLNVVVASVAAYTFIRAGYFKPKLLWPLVITSIPAAYYGAKFPVSDHVYDLLLAFALIVAAGRLALALAAAKEEDNLRPLPLLVALPAGTFIGFLSGILGIGGGIFLSPLLILGRWAGAKQASALAAVFILVNSLSGLGGSFMQHKINLVPMLPYLAAALVGGLLGSHIGAKRFSNVMLRRSLAIVLLLAAGKLLITVI